MAAASAALSGPPSPFQSSGASRLTIVRVHDDNNSSSNANAVDAGDMSDGTPSSFGVTAVSGSGGAGSGVARPGRSNSWGSNYSSGSNASGHAPTPARSHSPGAARRPGGTFVIAKLWMMYLLLVLCRALY